MCAIVIMDTVSFAPKSISHSLNWWLGGYGVGYCKGHAMHCACDLGEYPVAGQVSSPIGNLVALY